MIGTFYPVITYRGRGAGNNVKICFVFDPVTDVSAIAYACGMSTDTVYRCLRHMAAYLYYIPEDIENSIYVAVAKRMSELRRLAYGHVYSCLNGKYYKLAISVLRMPQVMKVMKETIKKNTFQTMPSLYVMPRKMFHSVPGIVGEKIDAARAEIAATAAVRNERAGWAAVPGPAILELYLMVRDKDRYTREEIMAIAEEALNSAGVVNTETTVEEVIVPQNEFTICSLTDQQIREYSNIPSKAASWSARESFVYGKKALGRKAKYATISYLLEFAKNYKIPHLQLPELAKVYATEDRWIAQAVAWGFAQQHTNC